MLRKTNMKHLRFQCLSGLFLLLLLCGCEKRVSDIGDEGGGEIEGTGHLVSIQAVLPQNVLYENEYDEAYTPPASLGDYFQRVTFAVFQDGERRHLAHQQSGGSDFGIYQVRLEEGTYQLVIIAHNGTGNITVTKPDEVKFPDNKVTETFYCYATLTVSGTTSKTYILKRAVAKIQFYCKDPMPDNVAQMKFYYTGGSSTFNAVTGLGCVNSRQTEYRTVTSEMIGHPVVFPLFTFPHDTNDEVKLVVTALDAAGNELQKATYETVSIELDNSTIVEKYFFTSSDYQEYDALTFTLIDDADWSAIDRAY